MGTSLHCYYYHTVHQTTLTDDLVVASMLVATIHNDRINHVSCGKSSRLSSSTEFRCIWSSIAEQSFSFLRPLESSVSYMSVSNATAYVKFFFTIHV